MNDIEPIKMAWEKLSRFLISADLKRSSRLSCVSLVATAIFCVSVSGCAGARHDVRFASAEYPISLTSAVPVKGKGDNTVRNQRTFESIGRFHAEQVGKSIFWTFIPLNKIDFSHEINEQVGALEGDAVINLRITATDTGFGRFGLFSFLHWFPFWPGDVKVILDGDIIRVRK